MKLLQEKEPDEEDEFYNLIFAEKSSDEEFNPSQTEFSEDSQNSFEAEEKTSEEKESGSIEKNDYPIEISSIEKEESLMKKARAKIKLRKKEILPRESKRRDKKKEIQDIVDIDLLDIDKIDEIEEMREKGVYQEDFSDEKLSEEEDDEESYKKKKKKKKGISKKKISISERKNNFLLDDQPESKKFYKKAFIDDEEEGTFIKKRQRSITQKFKNRQIKKNKLKFRGNPNVIINKNDPDTLIISKAIFEEEKDEESIESQTDYDIMEYNDEFFRDQEKRNIQTEEENRKIIKKFKKPEKGQEGQVAVKYNFLQEKLSQKDLLIEAIFTEYYNIQSLQEMQRLEDLNKKETPSQGRREFSEYVRIVKRVPTLIEAPENQPKIEGEILERPEIPKKTQELVQHREVNKENDIMIDENKQEKYEFKEHEEFIEKGGINLHSENVKDSVGKLNICNNNF